MYVAYPLKFSVPEVVQATWEKIGIFQSHTLLGPCSTPRNGTHTVSTGTQLYIRNRYRHVPAENPSQALLAVPAYMYHRVFWVPLSADANGTRSDFSRHACRCLAAQLHAKSVERSLPCQNTQNGDGWPRCGSTGLPPDPRSRRGAAG